MPIESCPRGSTPARERSADPSSTRRGEVPHAPGVWRRRANRNVEVLGDTDDLYRYFDCTAEAEFLYACVARAVEHDLPEEIDYLRRHDEAQRRIMETVEMPDRLAQDLIAFIRRNDGKLPKRLREREFAALTDEEAAQIEAICEEFLGDG